MAVKVLIGGEMGEVKSLIFAKPCQAMMVPQNLVLKCLYSRQEFTL
jgi:hypothetical protein